MKKRVNKYLVIMFILIVIAEVLVRINNDICNLFGIVLLPIIIIFGFMLIYKDKKQNLK